MVLLDPIGLWRDDAPVAPYMVMSPEKLVATLYGAEVFFVVVVLGAVTALELCRAAAGAAAARARDD